MAYQSKSLDIVLIKNQAVRGTVETSLLAADVAEVEVGATITPEYRIKKIDLVGSPQSQSMIGAQEASVNVSYPLRTGNAEGSQGQVATFLKSCMMAVASSDTDIDSTADRFIYTPSYKESEFVDSTVWGYSGNRDTSSSWLTKVQNVMFSPKFSLNFSEGYATVSGEGKGVLVSAPELATQPAVTPSTIVSPSLLGATISFFSDSDYNLLSLEFDLKRSVNATIKPSVSTGLGITEPGEKLKVTWTAKAYLDTGIAPHTALRAGTLGTISVAWGTAPNKFTISTTKAQIEDIKESEESGLICVDLSGICVDNNFAFQIDTAVAA